MLPTVVFNSATFDRQRHGESAVAATSSATRVIGHRRRTNGVRVSGDVVLHLSAGLILGFGCRGIETQPRSVLPDKVRVVSWLGFLVIAVINFDAVFVRL